MDRNVLIEKIHVIDGTKVKDLNKLSDEDLFSYYQELEDNGAICDYSD